ncbi:Cytochrome C oxidase, cbb3-type, subunit III [Nitrosomonas halophila]|uniref:Cytochrome C oxidase, cbb3-type, subunit III n=1 Tax=Nitrosomonas halophila TaxID=44576 RepID=A0A1H3FM94_9PROT|nr:c-type cytochrome [Nitrosomonas halophila]SDX91508.1 Cytochrome C oxidase, cbb3-type, subunit III [Nitrosomonas halophila]
MALTRIALLVSLCYVTACSDQQTAAPASEALDRILGRSMTQEPVIRDFDPAQVARGQAIFRNNCAGCHGQNAEGTPDWRKPLESGRYPPPPLNGTAHAWHHSTEELKRFILNGGPPGEGRMPGWAGILTDQEIDDVLVWIKSLWPDEVYEGWYTRIENRP